MIEAGKPMFVKELAEWSASTRAGNGARWLDRQVEDWFEWIDLEKLDMGDGASCIAGQVEWRLSGLSSQASYLDFCERFDLGYGERQRLGFNVDVGSPLFYALAAWVGHYAAVTVDDRELGLAWRKEIQARRAAQVDAVSASDVQER